MNAHLITIKSLDLLRILLCMVHFSMDQWGVYFGISKHSEFMTLILVMPFFVLYPKENKCFNSVVEVFSYVVFFSLCHDSRDEMNGCRNRSFVI